MKKPFNTATTNDVITAKPEAFIGIDYHKRYSVYCALDGEGKELARGRIEHHSPGKWGQGTTG